MYNKVQTKAFLQGVEAPFYISMNCIKGWQNKAEQQGGSTSKNIKEVGKMKKLEIIIKPEKLEDLKAILDESEVNGLNIVNIMGYGNQKGIVKKYRGAEYRVNLLPKIKVETVVSEDKAEALIDKIVKEVNTGNYGDGKIFVYEVEDAVRIRTGERGEQAL